MADRPLTMFCGPKPGPRGGYYIPQLKTVGFVAPTPQYNDLRLEYPPVLPGRGKAILGDAVEASRALSADLFYLDPPYNQHSYLGNYHVWETLVRWDNPETYGIAQKRIDVRDRKSPFNSKREAKQAMLSLFSNIKARHLVVSFNNEGFFAAKEIEEMLKGWGYVSRLTRQHQRYVGARIGIYNPQGEKVGQISHTENHEFLFVATHSRNVYELLKGQDSKQESDPKAHSDSVAKG